MCGPQLAHLTCIVSLMLMFNSQSWLLAMAEITMLVDCATLSQEEWCQGKEGFVLLVLLYP